MDFKFIIPTIIAIGSLIWNYYQQKKLMQFQKILEKKNLIHKLQFEKEFNIYNELWSKLIALRNLTASLRPIMEQTDGKSNAQLKEEKLKKLYPAFNEVIIEFDNNRPFYSEAVYNEINEILKISRSEAIEFEYLGYTQSSDYKKAEENINKIVSSMDKICDIIRKRIDFVEIQD
jgi:hypothetical protein